MMKFKTVGDFLTIARARCGVTQTAVAKHLELTDEENVSSIESGRRGPGDDRLELVAEIYEVEIEKLRYCLAVDNAISKLKSLGQPQVSIESLQETLSDLPSLSKAAEDIRAKRSNRKPSK